MAANGFVEQDHEPNERSEGRQKRQHAQSRAFNDGQRGSFNRRRNFGGHGRGRRGIDDREDATGRRLRGLGRACRNGCSAGCAQCRA